MAFLRPRGVYTLQQNQKSISDLFFNKMYSTYHKNRYGKACKRDLTCR